MSLFVFLPLDYNKFETHVFLCIEYRVGNFVCAQISAKIVKKMRKSWISDVSNNLTVSKCPKLLLVPFSIELIKKTRNSYCVRRYFEF